MRRESGEQAESAGPRDESVLGPRRKDTDSGSRRGPTRTGFVLAAGLVVITATVAATQFVLSPIVFATVLLVGTTVGVAGALLSHYRRPSRTFLVLAIPLVFLGTATLQESLGIAEHTVLVGLSAVVIGGTVTDTIVTSQ